MLSVHFHHYSSYPWPAFPWCTLHAEMPSGYSHVFFIFNMWVIFNKYTNLHGWAMCEKYIWRAKDFFFKLPVVSSFTHRALFSAHFCIKLSYESLAVRMLWWEEGSWTHSLHKHHEKYWQCKWWEQCLSHLRLNLCSSISFFITGRRTELLHLLI